MVFIAVDVTGVCVGFSWGGMLDHVGTDISMSPHYSSLEI